MIDPNVGTQVVGAALQGTIDVFTRRASNSDLIEEFVSHAEFHTGDGARYQVGVLSGDGNLAAVEQQHEDMALWLADTAGSHEHSDAEQLYRFSNEEAITKAVGLIHRGAILRTDVRVVSDHSTTGSTALRRVVVYQMDDSVWMLEHIQATDSGRFLRLRSTGRRDLAAYLGQMILPERTQVDVPRGTGSDTGRCSSSTTEV